MIGVEIFLDRPGGAEVFLDGELIPSVKAVKFPCGAGNDIVEIKIAPREAVAGVPIFADRTRVTPAGLKAPTYFDYMARHA